MSRSLPDHLEARPNPSRWATLFDLALPALDRAMPDESGSLTSGGQPRWTLGGGTALALRLGHRISDDVDIFISGVRLAELTPHKNSAAKTISDKFDWPGHYLKFRRPDGEVDFLSSPLQTVPGFSVETFRNRQIALETISEVMVKKLRYRSASFTLRDAFDLACVLKAKPETVLTLAAEVADTIPRAKLALSSLSNEKVRTVVRAMPAFADVLLNPVDRAKSGLDQIEWLRDNPISEQSASTIAQTIATVEWFEPGSRPGLVRFGWEGPAKSHEHDLLAVFEARPIEAKAALLDAWRSHDPEAFHRWDSQGRPAARAERTVAAKKDRGRDR